ncbi:MAG: hypothetical protein Q4D33_10620 [Prevotellaceae bacterium]|nr:hypothetical protein [Prevotellaceae bacterium]
MQIPISVARQAYIEKICDVTNNSGLPAFAMADILEKLLAEVRKMEQDQLAKDMQEYTRARDEEMKRRNDNDDK